jgi:hypothetical protein
VAIFSLVEEEHVKKNSTCISNGKKVPHTFVEVIKVLHAFVVLYVVVC